MSGALSFQGVYDRVEALGKPGSYDPRHDSSVRLQTSKLRQKIIEYCLTEGKADPVQIDFPRGRFKLIFTARESVPSATPLDERASKWGRPTIALGIALAIAVCLCIYWGISAAKWRRAATNSGAALWQPALEEFWSPFLNSSIPTVVCVGAPMFLMLRPGSLILRSPGINTWEEAENTGLVDKLKEAFPGRSPQEWYVFTGLGEADGAFRLGQLLAPRNLKMHFVNPADSCIHWQSDVCCGALPESKIEIPDHVLRVVAKAISPDAGAGLEGVCALKKSLTGTAGRLVAALITIAVVTTGPAPAQQSSLEQPDNYTWLEDIHGERQMAWVKAENARTAAVLEKDSHFAPLQAEVLKLLESPDRLPDPKFRNGVVYNTWQDAEHVRGIIRRTTLKDYLTAQPRWETVLDYDALSKAEKQSWVGEGLTCLQPEDELCLVELSAGGEDASTLREMDLKTGKFVEGGFVLPRGKQSVAWVDKDTLLIGRDWGPGTMSEAGYPITVRQWKRGEPLENAREVFRGDVKDNGYGDNPRVFMDGQGHRAVIVERNLSTFAHEIYLFLPGGAKKLSLPLKERVSGLLDGQLLVTLEEDWTPDGQTKKIDQGSVVALDLAAVEKDPARLKPTVVFAPTAQEFEEWFGTTKNHLILATLEHVQQRAYVYTLGSDGNWTRKRLPVPDNQTIDSATASRTDDRFFLGVEGFLTPPSLWLGDAGDGSFALTKSQKPQFDASGDVVEQLEATSKDGTRVPYFLVHRKNMAYDGSNATLLTAYGGFQTAYTPSYSAVNGKLWLERGGVYVVANIRGGGEFGPAWHEAGLKTHRQRIYDDFYAVAQDLVARKITSSRRLGIIGGSNGGLLMGVEFTQHPEMWNAVVIQVPLLDMLGFEHLSAGASWVGEYGSVSVPEERAFLASISPYNQLKPDVHYPEPLVFTTTKDDRVGPVHARKFAARMEEFHKPFFYDEITEGGHGEGADNKQEARTEAENFTYLMMKLMDSTGPGQH